MKQELFTITENIPLTESMYRMRLQGDTEAVLRPGQFVNLRLDGKYLRRPISVCDCDAGSLTILYKVVGAGTAQMSGMKSGTQLDILTGLGNGYDLSCAGDNPLLIGGGAGVPPMYWLAKKLQKHASSVTVILGFNTASEIFYEKEFKDLGVDVKVVTVDGSYGIKGFVTDAVDTGLYPYSYYYACGPVPMLKAVYRSLPGTGEMSFEQRMGCGFGACMGCSIQTKHGYKRVCKEGPVFKKEEILWED